MIWGALPLSISRIQFTSLSTSGLASPNWYYKFPALQLWFTASQIVDLSINERLIDYDDT